MVLAGDPGFNCISWVDKNSQLYNLSAIDKTKQTTPWKAELNMTHTLKAGTIYFEVCHTPSVAKGVCQAGYKSQGEFGYVLSDSICYPLSKNVGGAKDNTKWHFLPILPKPVMNTLNKIFKTTLYMLRGAPVENAIEMDSGSDDKNKYMDTFMLDNNSNNGVQITGTNNSTGTLPFNIQMNLNCDPKSKAQTLDGVTFGDELYTINMTSKDACGHDFFSFWHKIGNYKYVIGGVGVAICALLAFFAFKWHKVTIGSIGFFSGAILAYVVLSMFWTDYNSDYKVWLVCGFCIVVGIVLAVVLVLIESLSFFVAGGFLGAVLGFWSYNLVLHQLDTKGENYWLWITVVALALLFALLSLWLQDSIFILSTSFGFSYLSIKLLGTMIGNYPDETMIAREIQSGKYKSMPVMGYVY